MEYQIATLTIALDVTASIEKTIAQTMSDNGWTHDDVDVVIVVEQHHVNKSTGSHQHAWSVEKMQFCPQEHKEALGVSAEMRGRKLSFCRTFVTPDSLQDVGRVTSVEFYQR